MKGAYPTLSHSMLLLLGMIALSLIVASLSISFLNIERDLTAVELNFIADSVKNKILETYSLVNQSSNYSTGYFQLSLPEKLGNKRYSITLSQNKLLVNTSARSGPIETSRDLTINAQLNGSLFAPASLEIEKQNGIIKIGLVK